MHLRDAGSRTPRFIQVLGAFEILEFSLYFTVGSVKMCDCGFFREIRPNSVFARSNSSAGSANLFGPI